MSLLIKFTRFVLTLVYALFGLLYLYLSLILTWESISDPSRLQKLFGPNDWLLSNLEIVSIILSVTGLWTAYLIYTDSRKKMAIIGVLIYMIHIPVGIVIGLIGLLYLFRESMNAKFAN